MIEGLQAYYPGLRSEEFDLKSTFEFSCTNFKLWVFKMRNNVQHLCLWCVLWLILKLTAESSVMMNLKHCNIYSVVCSILKQVIV